MDNGRRIIINDGGFHTLTWRERLFSWPWRPWRTRTFVAGPADGEIYQGAAVMIMNSRTKRDIEEQLKEQLSRPSAPRW